MTDRALFNWLKLALTPHIGPVGFLKLIHEFGSPEGVFAAPRRALEAFVTHRKALAALLNNEGHARAEAALRWQETPERRLMTLNDADYPTFLAESEAPPAVLFLAGNPALLQRPCISMVGSRHPSAQGRQNALSFAQALSERGICVVSGLAAGIDRAAHEGALSGQGSTIAVLGTGIETIYPKSNQTLADRIAEEGLLVSEFALDTAPIPFNFPRRNRIIAALGQATVVVEAALESGSLITARLAGEIGREVMAVPGSIHNPLSKGCHALIKSGAKLIESLEDILSECPALAAAASGFRQPEAPAVTMAAPLTQTSLPQAPAPHIPSALTATAPQHTVSSPDAAPAQSAPVAETAAESPLLTQLGFDPVHPDELAETLGMSAADVYAELVLLEMNGDVTAVAGGRFQRVFR